MKSFSVCDSGSVGVRNFTELAPEELTACSICNAEQHVDRRLAISRVHAAAPGAGLISQR